jgi:hypothetical protein
MMQFVLRTESPKKGTEDLKGRAITVVAIIFISYPLWHRMC